ncbi:MAG: hypothetical protein ABI599_01265 [Flavobacteriales bacterium]
MRKVNRFMEIFWLVVAVVTFGIAIWVIIKSSFAQSWTWLLFPVFSVGMFLVRRFMRGKLEAMEARDAANGK